MVVVSMLPKAEFGRNNYQEGLPMLHGLYSTTLIRILDSPLKVLGVLCSLLEIILKRRI